jgi:hypothetical protein
MSPKRISLLHHPELELGYLSPFSDTAMLLIIPSDTSESQETRQQSDNRGWIGGLVLATCGASTVQKPQLLLMRLKKRWGRVMMKSMMHDE